VGREGENPCMEGVVVAVGGSRWGLVRGGGNSARGGGEQRRAGWRGGGRGGSRQDH
jgi:hypothetical protein